MDPNTNQPKKSTNRSNKFIKYNLLLLVFVNLQVELSLEVYRDYLYRKRFVLFFELLIKDVLPGDNSDFLFIFTICCSTRLSFIVILNNDKSNHL
jgi:hypothetical protein